MYYLWYARTGFRRRFLCDDDDAVVKTRRIYVSLERGLDGPRQFSREISRRLFIRTTKRKEKHNIYRRYTVIECIYLYSICCPYEFYFVYALCSTSFARSARIPPQTTFFSQRHVVFGCYFLTVMLSANTRTSQVALFPLQNRSAMTCVTTEMRWTVTHALCTKLLKHSRIFCWFFNKYFNNNKFVNLNRYNNNVEVWPTELCQHDNVVARTDFFIYPIKIVHKTVIDKLMRGYIPIIPLIYATASIRHLSPRRLSVGQHFFR